MKPKRFQLSVGALRAFSLALFACLQASPVRAQDQSVSGNLTVSGTAQIWGGVDIGSGANHTVDWDAPNFRVTGDINSIPGSFIWRDSYAVINSAALQGDRQNTLVGGNYGVMKLGIDGDDEDGSMSGSVTIWLNKGGARNLDH